MDDNDDKNVILTSSDGGSDGLSGDGATPLPSDASTSDQAKPDTLKIDALLNELIQELDRFNNLDSAEGTQGVTLLENMLNTPGSLSVDQSSPMTPVPAEALTQHATKNILSTKDSLSEVEQLAPTEDTESVPNDLVDFVDLLKSDLETGNQGLFLSSSVGFRSFNFNLDLTSNDLSTEFGSLRKSDIGLFGGSTSSNSFSSDKKTSTDSTASAGESESSSSGSQNDEAGADDDGGGESAPPVILPDLFTAGNNTIDFNTLALSQYTNNGVYDARGGDDTITLPDIANIALTNFVIGTDFFAGEGNDQITGGDGGDKIYGDAGNDILNGADGNDSLFGGAGNDTLTGGLGDDVMDGGANDDLIIIGAGSDAATGGTGSDTFQFANSTGVDTIADMETGVDTIDISALLTGWNSILHAGFFRIVDNGGNADLEIDADGGGDGFVQIATLTGVNLDAGVALLDVYAGATSNMFTGNADAINFNNMEVDWYVDGTENNAGAGNDIVTLADGANEAAAGYTNGSVFYGESGNDTITGGDQGDKIDGGADNDVLTGNGGNDTLIGGTGNDVLTGGAGADSLDAGAGIDSLTGGVGNDSYILGADGAVDRIIYNAGDTTGSAVDTITGFQTGEDIIDISALISNWNSLDYADFFRIVDNGADAELQLDANGGGDNFVQIALLIGVNLGAGIDLTDITGGTLSNLFTGNADVRDFNSLDANWYADGSQYNSGGGNDYVVLANIANAAASGFTIGTSFDAGAGDDIVIGGDGDDVILGNAGTDTLRGGRGDDTFDGGFGADVFTYLADDLVGGGSDVINNFVAGIDKINVTDLASNYNAGSPGDSLQLVNSGSDVLVQISVAGDGGSWVTVATVTGVQVGAGISTSDILIGTPLFTEGNDSVDLNVITSADFSDGTQYNMGAGDDTLYLRSNAAMDADGFSSTADYHGGAGVDYMSAFSATTYSINFYGDAGDDTLYGGQGGDYLYGGDGNDSLYGYTGNDYMDGGAGDDTITSHTGDHIVYGGDGNDIINVTNGSNYIDGGAGDDTIIASNSAGVANTILGGAGFDTMTANSLADTFVWQISHLDGSVDTISGYDTADDFLNVSAMMVAYDGTKANYARFVDDGADTTFQIDRDGAGSTYTWEDVTTLTGVTLAAEEVSIDDVIFGQVYADLFDDGIQNVDFNSVNSASYTPGSQYDAGDGHDIVVLPDLVNENGSGFVIGTAFDAGAGNDTVTGGDGDDVISGGSGGDVLRGGAGADTLDGGTGSDVFEYYSADISGGDIDVINNFQTGSDQINIGDLWSNYDSGSASDFWQIVDSGSDALLQISPTGNGSGWITIANITGVNLGSGIETTDIAAGTILFDDGNNSVDLNSGLAAGEYLDGTQYNLGGGNDTLLLRSNAAMTTAGFDDTTAYRGGDGNDIISGYSAVSHDLTLYGDAGIDSLWGGSGGDVMYGGTGDDRLYGYLGNDYMDGGDGNDYITSHTGNHVALGGDGNDYIQLSYGSNYMDGGAGDDVLIASNSSGNYNTIIGGSGFDTMTANSLADTFVWTAAHLDGSVDTISGFDTVEDFLDVSQSLILYDGTKADYVRFVDDGANTVLEIDRDGSGVTYGWEEVTTLTGVTLAGGGVSLNDVLTGDVPADLFDENDNTLDFNFVGAGQYIDGTQYSADEGNDHIILPDLASAAAAGFTIGTAFYAGIGDDIIQGGDGADVIYGGIGADTLLGGGGSDTLDGGTGDDIFKYDRQDINGGAVDTINNFISGSDIIDLSDFWENYNAGSAADFWQIVDSGSDALVQVSLDGSGSDWVTVASVTGVNLGAGIETSDIGAGAVLFNDADNSITWSDWTAGDYVDGTQYNAGSGNDQVYFNSTAVLTTAGVDNTEEFHGGAGDDYLYAQYGAMNVDLTLHGDSGNDYIAGGQGDDKLYGGDGNDTLYGYTGNDYMDGGAGHDYFTGNTGNYTIFGRDGNDYINMSYGSNYIDAGAGDDTIIASASAGYSNVIIGGAGVDTMTARGLQDTFIWYSADLDGSVDTISGFDAVEDFLDVSRLLIQFNGTTSNYVRFVDDGGDTVMEVDRDGTGVGYGWEEVTTLTGITLAGSGVSLGDVITGGVISDLFDDSDNYIDLNSIEASQYNAASQYDAGIGDDYVILPDIEFETQSGFTLGTAFNAGHGDDTVYGGNGDDVIHGGAGDDILFGGQGSDTLDGGTGNDIFKFHAQDFVNSAVDVINNFETGVDKIDLSAFWNNYDSGNASDFWQVINSGADALVQISLDGNGADWMTVATITGVNVGAGIETSDIAVGTNMFGDGNDVISFSDFTAGDYVDGTQYNLGHGNDELYFISTAALTTAGVDSTREFHGGAGDDILYGQYGGMTVGLTLHGDAGIDSLIGGGAADVLLGGTGDDYLNGYTGNDYMDGGDGNDVILSNTGNHTVFGRDGNDYISLSYGTNYIDGGTGDDTILAGNSTGNFNVIIGGAGVDTMTARGLQDTFIWYSDHLDGSVDTISGFDAVEDTLDVSHLLVQFDGTLSNYVRFVDDGANTVMEVDRDGTGTGGYGWEEVTSLTGITLAGGGVSLNDVYGGSAVADLFTGSGDNVNFNLIEAGEYIAASQYAAGVGNDYVRLPDIAFATRAGFVIGTSFDAGHGDDIVLGGDGDDVIAGGTGDDTIFGGKGSDTLDGGTGNDVFSYNAQDFADGAVDVINNFETGLDKINLAGFWDNYNAGSASDFWQVVDSGSDALVQISLDGNGADWVTIATVTNVNVGSGIETSDILAGNALFDDGHNVVNFNTVTDGDYVDGTQYHFGDGDDQVTLGSTNAAMTTAGFDPGNALHLGDGADYVYAYYGGLTMDLTIYGEGGNDNIWGGTGNDSILGGDGADYLSGYQGNDYMDGGDGDDYLTNYNGVSSMFGRDGNDIIISAYGTNHMDGGAGDDVITGSNAGAGGFTNTIIGGAGFDTMTARNHNDTFIWYSDHLDGSVDTIAGFDLLEDTLDVSHLLVQFDGTLSNYVRFVDDGANTVMEVDRDGTGTGGYGWEEVTTLTGITLAGSGVSLNDVYGGSAVADLFTFSNDSINFNIIEAGEYIAASQYAAGVGDDYIILPDIEFATRAGFTIGTSFNAGHGDDIVYGGDGDDVIAGGTGDDTLTGGKGSDTLDGGTGNDVFMYRAEDIAAGAEDLINNFTTGNDVINLSGMWNDYDSGSASDFWQIVDNGADAEIQVSLDGSGDNWVTIATVDGVNLGSGIENSDIEAAPALFSDEQDTIIFADVTDGTYADGTQYDTGAGNDDVFIANNDALTDAGFDASNDFHLGDGEDYLSAATAVSSDLTIYGDAGNDEIYTGAGNDLIYGGEGNDYLSGYSGNDYMDGGDGDDYLTNYSGVTSMFGGDGNDIIFSSFGTNHMDGGAGDDVITGSNAGVGGFTNTIIGGAGFDTMTARNHSDTFIWYSDHLDGSVDTIAGFDLLEDTLDVSHLLVQFDGTLSDYVRFVDDGANTVMEVDRDGTGTGGYGWEEVTSLTGITLAGGGVSLNDVYGGSAVANLFTANADSINFNIIESGEYIAASQYASGNGDDYIILADTEFATRAGFTIGTSFDAGAGNDIVYGGDGDDVIVGGADDDTLIGGKGSDTLDGGTGNDVFMYRAEDIAAGAEDLINNFTTGNDVINLSGMWNDYNAGNASDFWQIVDNGADAEIQVSLDGSGDNWVTIATVNGVNLGAGIENSDIQAAPALFGDGIDTINFTDVTAGTYADGTQYDTGAGNDDLTFATTSAAMTTAGFDPTNALHLGDGEDYVYAYHGGMTMDLTIYGDAGNDEIYTGAGNDLIYGGEGNDQLWGSSGNDELYGGDGDDYLVNHSGAGSLYGEDGSDILSGGLNDDLIVGGTGADVMTSGTGNDVFQWNNGDFDNAELDRITDFADGTDMLDLVNLLVGYTGPGDFGDFINIISNGSGGTMVQLDLDGSANGSNYQDFLEITNVGNANITSTDFIME